MKFSKLIPFFLLFTLAFFLRSDNLANHTTFDWDQDRDYSQVLEISRGDHKAIGPVVKGSVGGFYLGSLYYYLLLPAFTITSGALISLPLTSIIIDSIVAGLIYFLFARIIGKPKSFILALVWSISWFLISTSRVSWNVALIPVWSLFIIYTLTKLHESRSIFHFYLLAFLGGLTFHIHVSLIGIFPLLLIFSHKSIRFSPLTYLKAFLLGIIPITPLIYHDVTHAYLNLRLVRNFITSNSTSHTTYADIFRMAMIKLGKVVNALYFSRFADSYLLGIFITILAFINYFRAQPIFRISSILIITNLSLVILLKDYGFPEYYFAISYLPIYLITLNFLAYLLSKAHSFRPYITCVITVAIVILNIQSYSTVAGIFSLGAKKELVSSITTYQSPLSIHYSFDPGRDGGLQHLVNRSNIIQDAGSSTQILLTDKIDSPGYINGELCEDIVVVGHMKSAFHIVQ